MKLHNVREITAHPEVWNYSFLVISFVMIIIGYKMMVTGEFKSLDDKPKSSIFG